MAPNVTSKSALYLPESSAEPVQIISQAIPQQDSHLTSQISHVTKSAGPQYRWKITWRNVILFTYLHISAFYGLYYVIAKAQWKTFFWAYFVAVAGGVGVTAGAHRMWAHRAYKAKLPLRIILAILQTLSLQNDIYEWVRDHRVHHKFTDTNADPHNAKRGFFFSHMGWLLIKKHNDVKTKGGTVDMSDIEADPVVRFQKKYYLILAPLLCFIFPTWVPWYYWNENLWMSFHVAAMFRYTISLHCTWLVNSAAHIWGTRPYDQFIKPTESLTVAILAFGEGWHNYHHVFPWDYKAAELGNYRTNFSTAFIDLMAKTGWAYDLKSVSVDMIKKRVKRTGDGSKIVRDENVNIDVDNHHENSIWGWGDQDMKEDDKMMVEYHHKVD